MTNSHKSQSGKLAAGGGRETAAKKPHDNKVPGLVVMRLLCTPLTGRAHVGGGSRGQSPEPTQEARAREPRVDFWLHNHLSV